MKPNFRVIVAIVKKDLHGLLPLVLLASAVFLVQPIITNLNLEDMAGDSEFWVAMSANFYWLGYFLASLLMISVLQQDPAVSLNHDWLTRPIARIDWLFAKLLFLVMTVCLPVIISRTLVNLGEDFGVGLSLSYALAIEKLAATLAVPLLFTVALLTPTLRKTIFVLVLTFFVFLLPSWSVSRPLLEMLGIELGGEFNGMMWLQGLPIFTAGVLGVLLTYWLLYTRRQYKAACAVFCVMVAIVFITVFPPSSLYNWDDAIAIHKAIINTDLIDAEGAALEEAVVLEHALACFPAAVMDDATADGQSDSLLVQAAWTDLPRRIAGSGAITFATTVKSRDVLMNWFTPSSTGREISVDWRIDRFRTQGRFTADSLLEDIQLVRSPTAVNRFAPISNIDTDYWLVPGEAVERLAADPSARLVLDFDLALLSPTSYELETDGMRREFPELGSCKAEIERSANRIQVDCIKRGVRPELVSVELIGVSASRVDNLGRANLAADWIEAIDREHYELTLNSPDLVDSSAVMLTAYNVERILHKQLVTKGMLGDSLSACPLPTDAQFASLERSNWSDKSPHQVSSIAVERGVRVEVLDWRTEVNRAGISRAAANDVVTNGVVTNEVVTNDVVTNKVVGNSVVTSNEAPTLFLLPGLGATVHSYDEVAAKLAQKYNVVGMTRRGVGDSSKPDHGYDIARLSQDVLEVLNTLGIEAPVLIGHSIAGEELSYLGVHFPERFSGLVYLDAAYDRTDSIDRRYRQLNSIFPEAPPIHPAEAVSYAALSAYADRTGRVSNIPEGEILASYELDTGRIKHNALYLDAIMMGLQAPDYKRIPIPALGIFAVPGSAAALMEAWYDQNNPVVQASLAELYEMERTQKLDAITRFDSEIPNSIALPLENADHWIFLSHKTEVLAAIEEFVDGLR